MAFDLFLIVESIKFSRLQSDIRLLKLLIKTFHMKKNLQLQNSLINGIKNEFGVCKQ